MRFLILFITISLFLGACEVYHDSLEVVEINNDLVLKIETPPPDEDLPVTLTVRNLTDRILTVHSFNVDYCYFLPYRLLRQEDTQWQNMQFDSGHNQWQVSQTEIQCRAVPPAQSLDAQDVFTHDMPAVLPPGNYRLEIRYHKGERATPEDVQSVEISFRTNSMIIN